MPKLTDQPLLADTSEEITVSDFRSRPGDVLMQVQMGRTFTITKNGKPVAVIAKPELNALQLGAALRRIGRTPLKVGDPFVPLQEADQI
jgi:antitoxin (DNA-binding transcriptional repressor) of toxin-antitoxin stability system